MKTILIVGATGRGKTTISKALVKKVILSMGVESIVINDVNNEYEPEIGGGKYMKEDDFLNYIEPLTKKYILIEEATIYFSSRKRSDILRQKLVRKRHDKNMFTMVFHGLQFIPEEIIGLCDYLILFKTNDGDNQVRAKFKGRDDIMEQFQESKNFGVGEYAEIKLI